MRGNNKSPVVAITCSDLHLWHKAPLARSCEEDWLEAQAGYLRQLCHLQEKHKPPQYATGLYMGNIPIIIAGDFFDKPLATPETINMALAWLPRRIYSIPGQHDLPSHRLEEMHRSAYGTLVASGRVINLPYGEVIEIPGLVPLRLHGFPWGCDVYPPEKPHDLALDIAVIHAYVWTKDTGYHGAPEEKRLGAYKKKLAGYDVAIFGDNHKGFLYEYFNGKNEPFLTVVNNGGFMRRKSDEFDYEPCVGLIHADGSVTRQPLDVSKDKFVDKQELHEVLGTLSSEDFIQSLLELGDTSISFPDTVSRLLDQEKASKRVRRIVNKAMLGTTEGTRP